MRIAYWRRRVTRHVVLGVVSGAVVVGVALLFPDRPRVFRLSMGTAYAGLGLLALTLVLGPWNVMRGRPNPVSTDRRRDIGIWAAVAGTAHVVFGLQVHLSGAMLQYFLWGPERDHLVPFRYDVAGVANFSGLASALVLLFLVALSNDVALRRLGAPRWKALQRYNYAGFGLMALHAAVYQTIEDRTMPWMVVMTGTVAVVVATQLAGWRRLRSRA